MSRLRSPVFKNRLFRGSLDSLSIKAKFQIGQFKSLKQLEGKGKVTRFGKSARHLDNQYTAQF